MSIRLYYVVECDGKDCDARGTLCDFEDEALNAAVNLDWEIRPRGTPNHQ